MQWVGMSSEYPCLPSTALSLFRGGVAYRGRERSLRCHILSDSPHIFQSRRWHLGARHSVQQLIRSVAHTVPTFLRCSGRWADVGGVEKMQGKKSRNQAGSTLGVGLISRQHGEVSKIDCRAIKRPDSRSHMTRPRNPNAMLEP